jgi:SAM-dependent methyltransferase
MRIITPEIIHTLITEFSQGAMVDYNPETGIGCQRESFSDLGYGWIYFAIARAFDARSALVVGSGRGFSVACLGLALDGKADSEVTLVDPGYAEWVVDGKVTERSYGLWQHGDDALSHFREKLGLNNIRLFPVRSDEAFEEYIKSRRLFDMIIIDGDHSHGQSLNDLKNALEVLAPTGILIVHDAYCQEWPGVATAIETIVLENPGLDRVTIPNYPGIAMIQKRPSTLSFRIATIEENEIINSWRDKEGLAMRPLSLTGVHPYEDDPQPGIHYENPNVGLFSVFENGELIGGFGLRYKTFMKEGPDEFLPDNGIPLSGYLGYGEVLHPDKRGRGRWIMINCMRLQNLITEGFYTITRYTEHSPLGPYTVKRVGTNLPYFAFHYQLKTIEQAMDNERLFREQQFADLTRKIASLTQAIAERDGQIAALSSSISWRDIWPLRIVGHQVERARRAMKLAMHAIRRSGGLKSTLKKAIQLYRREGLAGIKRGFRIVAIYEKDKGDAALK